MNTILNKRLLRNVKLDYLGTFLANLNMQSSIWVLYLSYCGLNLAQIGFLEGIYHATSIVCEIPSGAVADLLGRKRSMILSRVCIALSCIIMLLTRNFWLFALSFMIQAMGNNFNSGSEEALLYDSMKCAGQENQYIGVCGKLNMIIEVSQGIATVAGGILAERSYFWCYFFCFVISLLALIPVLFLFEPPVDSNGKTERKSFWETVGGHFKICFGIMKNDIRILKLMAYYSVIFAFHTLLFFYSQQYFWDMGFSKIHISLIMFFAGISSCLGAAFSQRLSEKLKEGTGRFCACVIALSLICFGFEKAWLSISVFILAGFFNSVLYPVKSEALNRLIPSGQRATLISVESMAFSMAMIVLFPLAGRAAQVAGLSVSLGICGVLLMVFVWLWEARRYPNHKM